MFSNTALISLAMVGADRGTILIHWDLPTESKTTFSLCFTFISSGVRSILSSAPAQQVRVILMPGPEDAASLSTIIPCLKRRGAVIPDGLDLFYKAVTGSPLCSILTTPGTCTDKMEGRCQARHFLHAELDSSPEKYEGSCC